MGKVLEWFVEYKFKMTWKRICCRQWRLKSQRTGLKAVTKPENLILCDPYFLRSNISRKQHSNRIIPLFSWHKSKVIILNVLLIKSSLDYMKMRLKPVTGSVGLHLPIKILLTCYSNISFIINKPKDCAVCRRIWE